MKDISKIKRIGIVGAGENGNTMVDIFASFGFEVLLFDVSANQIQKSQNLIRKKSELDIKQNRISFEDHAKLIERVRFTTELELLTHTDFVVEAIVDNLDTKLSFWSSFSSIAPDDIVLVSNSPAENITKLATVVEKPERFLGINWENSLQTNRLIEVIKGEKTFNSILNIVIDLAKSIEKKTVVL